MWVANSVFLLLLAASVGLPGSVQGGWVITDDVYEDHDGLLAVGEENEWPDSESQHIKNILVDDQVSPTPLEREPEEDELSDSAVWKVVLVVLVLLMSIVVSLSVAYYLCVWRGGRIHYHKHVST